MWNECGRTNVAKRRPGKDHNDFEKGFYETIEEPIYTPKGNLSKKTRKIKRKTQELVEYEALLERELRGHNPNLVVATGNHALEAVTGITGITNYRGSVLESKWRRSDGALFKVLAVEHPSYIIRGQLTNFWFLAHDLKKAAREAEFPEIRRVEWIETSDPRGDLYDLLENLAYIRKHPDRLWALDVETRAGTLACFSIAHRLDDGGLFTFCIPIQTTTGAYWTPEQECQIWEALADASSSNSNLCNQNIEYDIYYLLRYGVEPSGVWMDTMLAHSILYPEFPKGLDFLCSWYLDDVCLGPETKVLTVDLHWLPIKELQVGDALIGPDEYANAQGKQRNLRKSIVERTWTVKKRCYKLTLDDGREIIASAEHPWLARKWKHNGQLYWIKTGDLSEGVEISAFGDPWEQNNSYESGWLSGFLDGEGTVSQRMVSFGQNAGLALDQALSFLAQLGLTSRQYAVPGKKKFYKTVCSNMYDSLKLLGSIRPIRLLSKAAKLWEGAGAHSHIRKRRTLQKLEYLGERQVVGIQTSTKTFIAEGLYTHNCYYKGEGRNWSAGDRDAELWAYCCKDAVYTLRVVEAIDIELKQRGLWEIYHSKDQN